MKLNLSPDPTKLSFWSRLRNLPSIVWIFIIIGGLALLIGGIIGIFFALSAVEGFASILMIVVAWFVMRAGSDEQYLPNAQNLPSWLTAVGILFFAAMGMAIDQIGNPVYNQPFEWFFCPDGTVLERGLNITNPRPGTTNVSNEFTCVTEEGKQFVESINVGEHIGVRFVEYILVGYLLVFLNRFYSKLKRQRVAAKGGL